MENEKLEERRKKVLELNKKGNTNTKIAEILGISEGTVRNDLKKLAEEGEIIKKNKSEKKRQTQEERRTKVLELKEEGKTNKEIAKILGTSEMTVGKDIKELEKQGIPVKKSLEKRKNQILTLNKEGKSNKEIAEMLGISIGQISYIIKQLKDQGENIKKNPTKEKKQIREERRAKILQLKLEGKTHQQIAEILGISTTTIYKDIKKLKSQNVTVGSIKQERRAKVLELNAKGKTNREIGAILGISMTTVYNDIAKLKSEGRTIKSNKIKNMNTKKRAELDMLYYKQRFKQGTLQKEEIKKIKEIALYATNNHDDILFYIRVCIRFGMFQEAKYQINNEINNDNLTKEQKERVKEIKNQIQLMEQRRVALRILLNGHRMFKSKNSRSKKRIWTI